MVFPSLLLSESEVFTPFSRGSKPQKENSLSARLKTLWKFWWKEREFSFWGLEPLENGVKTSLSDNKSDGNTMYYGRIHRK